MQVHRKNAPVPEVAPQPQPPVPKPVPPPAKPRRRGLLPLVVVLIVLGVAGIYWRLQVAPQEGAATGSQMAAVRTAVVQAGTLERTLRISGKTTAANYVNIVAPRLVGSRSRIAAELADASIGVKGNVNVASTSSIAPASTMSSLSETGTVASSSSAAQSGGGFAGGSGVGSSRLQAATSRIGGSLSGSAGNVSTTSGQSGLTAMGGSGLGSTASNLSGGSSGPPSIGGGGGRSRGDFHMALEKLVPAGTRVKKGDVIAEFDRQYMETRLDDYEAAVVMHQANLRKTRADTKVSWEAHEESIEGAKAALDKAKLDVKAAPVLSAIQGERLRLGLEQAEAEHKQLLSEVEYVRVSQQSEIRTGELDVAQADLESRRASANVEKLQVRAPIDGMVVMQTTFRNGEMGQVREGDELHSGQPFMQVVDTGSMVIDATVNQVDVEQVRIGMKARVRFDAFPDLVLPARVYSIGTVAKASQFRREYVTEVPVQLKLEKIDPRVIPDLSVGADILIEPAEEGTLVPLAGIFSDGAAGDKYAYVQRGKDWEKRPVELGPQNHLEAVVRSGLAVGEEIALEAPRPELPRK